ncbi:MAG: 4Fe-4S binding protein, partial [Owenweeksia sp.]
ARAQLTWGLVALFLLVGILVAFFRRKHFNRQTRAIFLSVAALMAGLVLIHYFATPDKVLFVDSQKLRSSYGFLIGAAFSGVIGVGFYPLLGSRVWCRFGCPMAAILGFQQRIFSRFRITTNGGQCISCGNCSVYCEMGIDVRSYAQSGQNIVRSSCVGCGICSAVCPRGVLKLENGSPNNRMKEDPAFIGNADNLMEYIKK